MNSKQLVPISDSLSKALERLFKAGGFALAFGFGGLFLVVVSTLAPVNLKIPMFVVGCSIISICLLFFLFSSFRTRQVTKRIKDDLPLLDALQRTALQLIEFASLTQSFAFKHLSEVQKAVETVSPLIEALPIVGPAAKSIGLTDAARISEVIVDATESTKDVVNDLQEAIQSGNLKAIKAYSFKLEATLASLKTALKVDAGA